MRAGLDDVGIGALFGLYDYRFEVCAMLLHAEHLEREYNAGPHTISVPRMRPADGSELSISPPYPVNDADFKKLVAIIRIAVPYTGMILSTRETPEMRSALLKCGMSQISAGSRTDVGAYHKDHTLSTEANLSHLAGQFSLQDHRSTDQIVGWLMEEGYVPSWCTACYRQGRTGEDFMKICKAGDIHDFCHPNSLLTLQEYLQVGKGGEGEEGEGSCELWGCGLRASGDVGVVGTACLLGKAAWGFGGVVRVGLDGDDKTISYHLVIVALRAVLRCCCGYGQLACLCLAVLTLSRRVRCRSSSPPLQDYADPDLRRKGEEVIAREMGPQASEPLGEQARRRLERKMKQVKEGQHDVYI